MPPLPAALRRARAFSLIEVMAAVAIFAFGMVAVLGFFGPVTRTITSISDAQAAARVADAVRARIAGLPFDTALALLQDPATVRTKDASGAYNPNDGTRYPTVLFGKLGGDIGIYDPTVGRRQWYDASVPTPKVVANADKFFEIDLIRNETLSPKAFDGTAATIAYNIRVRWPAFVAASSGTAVQVGANTGGVVAYDHGKKQVMFFTGTLSR